MKLIYCFCLNVMALTGFSQTQKKPGAANPQPVFNQNQKASYSFGVLVASNLRAQAGDSLDMQAFYRGILDAYQNKALQIKMEECNSLVQTHVQTFSRRRGERIKKGSESFMEKNKLDQSVKITATGLQYKIINTGTGATPLASDRVTVHYTGKLIDGTIFDSSVQRGQPATFKVGGVISGWTEALQIMHEGDKWMLFIPQELGYGAGGNQNIPPYAALIFELELIKVN